MTSAPSIPKKGFGELLVESGMISQQELDRALEAQRKERRKLTDALITLGLMTPEDVAAALSLYLNVPIIDLKRHGVQERAVALVQERTAREHMLIPLDIVGDALVVVMEDPRNIGAIEDLSIQTNMRIQPAVGYPSQIRESIDIYYRASGEIERQVHDFAPTSPEGVEDWENLVSQSPIVRTLDLIISQAVRDRASDVHIEPQSDRVRIRYRIDGILREAMSLPSAALDPLVSRVKILAGMNITERRRPQGGQFTFGAGGHEVDIRTATMETTYGETMVIRILDKSTPLIALSNLGFLPEMLESYQRMLRQPFGMFLVSGPTGSGKTTTLYSSIGQLDRVGRNIMTIEDPVEYLFDNIKQTQVNERAGITFANGLRAMMRLDPDIILVGEIRDSDTAKIAIQAALTGHLVLSSIHANDAASVPFRLMDLGVEPYLISSVMLGTLAQRMARVVCHHCRVAYQPPPNEFAAYQEEAGFEETTLYRGSKCNFCSNTGYLGRTGIFELLPFSEEVRHLILTGSSLKELRAQANREGMVTLRRDGMMKVKLGVTTPSEVLRNVISVN